MTLWYMLIPIRHAGRMGLIRRVRERRQYLNDPVRITVFVGPPRQSRKDGYRTEGENVAQAAPRNDPHVLLVVKSTAGTWPDARFNRNNKAQKILQDGINHFHLDPSPAVPYILTRNGTQLDLNEKIGELGLQDGDVVVIEAGQPVDG